MNDTSTANPVELPASALLFDLDGTLIDSHAAVERSWRMWAEKVGVDPNSFLHAVGGRAGPDVMAEVLPDRPAGDNLADQQELLAWELADTDGVTALPGSLELLAAVEGWPWAIVTACPEELAWARLEAAGLPVPELVVTGDRLSAGKPDPQGYLLAARLMEQAPAGCVVFEDAPAGVVAGTRAGMSVVGLGASATSAQAVPTVLVSGLDQVEVASVGALLRLHAAPAGC